MLHEAEDGVSPDAAGESAPPACEVRLPHEQTVPFVFNSPHSGRYYPTDFLAATSLDKHEIRRSEDLLVDQLFAPVVRLGAPLISAVYPRAYLDVNREPYELDPKMFDGIEWQSMRIAMPNATCVCAKSRRSVS